MVKKATVVTCWHSASIAHGHKDAVVTCWHSASIAHGFKAAVVTCWRKHGELCEGDAVAKGAQCPKCLEQLALVQSQNACPALKAFTVYLKKINT